MVLGQPVFEVQEVLAEQKEVVVCLDQRLIGGLKDCRRSSVQASH